MTNTWAMVISKRQLTIGTNPPLRRKGRFGLWRRWHRVWRGWRRRRRRKVRTRICSNGWNRGWSSGRISNCRTLTLVMPSIVTDATARGHDGCLCVEIHAHSILDPLGNRPHRADAQEVGVHHPAEEGRGRGQAGRDDTFHRNGVSCPRGR